MSETDDLVELPDDPDHPHVWGRPWVLRGDEAERARAMMAAGRPDWLQRIIDAATVDGGEGER